MDKQVIKGRRRARKLSLQALYQWLMTGGEPYEIEAQFHAMNDMTKVNTDYFHQLIHGVIEQCDDLEEGLVPYLDRPIKDLNPIELTILRLSSFELLHCHQIPYRVVLDEAVSLAKAFGSQDGHRYVNGVLNNLAQKARAIEIRSENE